MRRDFYLATSLPVLPVLGKAPPMTPAELLEHLASRPAAAEAAAAIFLGDDLLQRQSLLAGQKLQAQPCVLSPGQLRDQEPLPEYLAAVPADLPAGRLGADAVWSAYYLYAEAVGRRCRNRFLALWVGFEVALRNALAAARAKALGLAVEDHLLLPALGQTDWNLGATVAEWTSAATPLEGLRRLDEARWDWIAAHDQWFSFTDDELAAYAARLLLLARWARIASGSSQTVSDSRPAEAGARG